MDFTILAIAAGSPARTPGLPPTLPRALADARPALERSAISARSSWATEELVNLRPAHLGENYIREM